MKNLLLLLLLFPCLANAQATQELRTEIKVRESSISKVEPIGNKGIITYGYKSNKKQLILELVTYDTNFKETFSTEIEIPKKHYFKSVINRDNSEQVFFVTASKKDLTLVRYDVLTNNTQSKTFSLKKGFICKEAYEMYDIIYIIGTIKNIPTILAINRFSFALDYITIPGENKKRFINSYHADEMNSKLAVFYRDGKDMKSSEMYLVFIDKKGNIENNPILLQRDPKYTIIDGKITWITENDFVISGTYGLDKSKMARGIYFSKWSNQEMQHISYQSFSDLENYFKYLSQKAEKRVEKSIKRKKEKGKEDFVKSLIATHPVVKFNDKYIYIGESYYPTYRTESYTTMVNGSSVTQTRSVFDGFQYTHGVIIAFDENGNKIYDHCFEINLNFKPFTVITNIRVNRDQTGKIKLIYSSGNKIRTAEIGDDKVIEKSHGILLTENENEKIKWTALTTSKYWYDNYFIIYGKQKIKDKTPEAEEKRRIVFFLSKVGFSE